MVRALLNPQGCSTLQMKTSRMVTKAVASGSRGPSIRGLISSFPGARPHHKISLIVPRASDADKDLTPAFGSIPPGSNGPNNDGGDDGEGDGGNGAAPAAAILAGKAIETLPAELAQALKDGKLPAEMLQRYMDMSKNPFLAWLMSFGGFRERLLADPSFMIKVAIEVGIGICTKTTAEYTKRGENFNSQIDFVFANLVMALIADFMLVWLPAPTFAVRGGAAAAKAPNALARVFAGCPDNAFQKVPPGYAPFSVGQRAGAVVRNGAKLFGVGLFASLLGVGITNGLVGLRSILDPTFVPLNDPQNVLVMSAAYGTYMASSSNLRYQILAGIVEERGIEVMFKSNPALCAALSFVVRTGNTFLGSLLWVDFLNILGLQKIGH
jgi:hypothetical protein